jgi:hypothetical protein
MSDFDRDLATLYEIGRILDNDSCYATPCLRVDLTCPAPMSARPSAVDAFLVEAAGLMGEKLTVYAAEGDGLNSSRGRKPRAADVKQLETFHEIMKRSELKDEAETLATIESLRAQGIEPNLEAMEPPMDCGNLLVTDVFPVHSSGNHIQLRGNGAWGISVSFALQTVLDHKAQVLDLIERFMLSGVATSASAGFAFNTEGSFPASFHELYYLPPTRRFRLLNMSAPSEVRFMFGEKGIVPINSWYWLDKKTAQDHAITAAMLAAVKVHVFGIEQNDNGWMIKLYEAPILGDLNAGFDAGPACALGQILDEALSERKIMGGVPLGDEADRIAWLRRFGPGFAASTVSEGTQ